MCDRAPLESWIARKIGRTGELTQAAIAEYQLARIRETVRWARTHSVFYAEHLSGVEESRIQCLSDLRHLPFTDAGDVRNHALQMLCVSQGDIHRVVTLESSGTSGDPKRVFFTADDQELTVDFFAAGMSTLVRCGQTVLIALPGERPGSVGDLLAAALRRIGVKPVLNGPIVDPTATVQVIAREQVDCIVGIPVQVLSLVRGQGRYVDAPSRNLTRVLLCSDHVPDSIAYEIHRAWNCEVFEHYGMTEMGLGGGVDCAVHAGYHLREADLYFEVIDPESDAPLADGEPGEVVFTTLTRRGMPFIRYRTGDISRLLVDRCACGSLVRRLDRVRLRKHGHVALGENSAIPIAELDEALFAIPGLGDFSASVKHGLVPTLTVTAFALRKNDVPHQVVYEAIKQLPAIRLAEKAGELRVIVQVTDRTSPSPNGKRKIVEQVA